MKSRVLGDHTKLLTSSTRKYNRSENLSSRFRGGGSGSQTTSHRAGKEPAVASILSDQGKWKYRWVNILRLELYMTPQWWIARGAGNCLRWKYRWVNILRLDITMTPQWWIARGASNCLRWKYRWVNILRLEIFMIPQMCK
ncbi:hypothetical protein E3N88_24999 [Mikania micrantha]|uniref:Uncharacterized protein n=1 Tax=Mikania micrantha TaxID=192012 RepID=A0A5N6N6B3_9ASTR|nr:hypothetical protein E3N88_24999 [Mikania micrantha]